MNKPRPPSAGSGDGSSLAPTVSASPTAVDSPVIGSMPLDVEKAQTPPDSTPPPDPSVSVSKPLDPSKSWREWRRENIGGGQMLFILLLQAFSAGLLDAFAYGDFETFASNQTGNMILLTLAAVGTVPVLLLLTGVSLAGFMLGAFIFGHWGTWAGARTRQWLLFTTSVQTLLMLVCGVLASPAGPRVTQHKGPHEWVVMFLMALMSGAQVCMARQSKCQEVPTAPMTSPLVDFLTDPNLFKRGRQGEEEKVVTGPRNRRMAYLGLVIVGSFLGAVLHRFANNWSIVVASVGVKAGVVLAVAVAKPCGV
ncbi:hypothetical protein Q8F55_006062 [Vanrija albida]|uniref:DUF1275 domain protein n=1 Tax=Vanrija albida TaxID=181172 RepID=A0ABR3Q3B0_9TREE